MTARGRTPKVVDAIALWSQWPTLIEADFERFYPRLNIADWHHGTRDHRGRMLLSSRKLIDLVFRLPEESQYKTYAEKPFGRGGNWPEHVEILKEIHNETSQHRASLYAGGENEYAPKLFLSPIERTEHFEQAAIDEQEFAEASAEFEAQLGWT